MSVRGSVTFEFELSNRDCGGTSYDAIITALRTVLDAHKDPEAHLPDAVIRDYDGFCELFSSMTIGSHISTNPTILKSKGRLDGEE